MSQPAPYTRQYNFATYQGQHPSDPLPGDEVDIELNAVKATLDETLANIALIQRDDGQLANGSVGLDQLSTEVTLGVLPAVMWLASINLAQNQCVFYNLILYRTIAACNTGATFNAAQFVELADLSSIAAPIGSVGTANLVDGCVTTPKLADGAVTPAKMTGFTGARLIGRYSATLGDLQTISVGGNLALSVGGALDTIASPTFTDITAASLSASGVVATGGAVTSGAAVSDVSGNVRKIPINSPVSAYALQLSDVGKCVDMVSQVTISAGVFGAGDNTAVFNHTGSNQSLVQGAGVTMYWAGNALATGNRTIANGGFASVLWLNSTTCVISGTGLS